VCAEEEAGGVNVIYRPRGIQDRCRLQVACVVNCTGPSTDFSRISQPLIRKLLHDGKIRPDPLRLGLDVDDDLRLLGRDGRANPRLFALGPITKGRFWEMTAVPEIRCQAEWLAKRLMESRFRKIGTGADFSGLARVNVTASDEAPIKK
jgi:uncharacterized NAD(P)/FAD-binding protein YdhS